MQQDCDAAEAPLAERRVAVPFFERKPADAQTRCSAARCPPPTSGLLMLRHEVNVNSSSKTIPWTKIAVIDLEESITAGHRVGRVGLEPTT